MLTNIETSGSSIRDEESNDETEFRDIHALTPTAPAALSRRSSDVSVVSDLTINSSENFTTMSREFNALVLAGSSIVEHGNNSNLERIGEDEEESNPLAIVPDNSNPLPDDHISHMSINISRNSTAVTTTGSDAGEIGVHRVKKDEVDAKIAAWETAKIAKINNRFKREDAIITGWENEQVHKASTRMKIVERKLEEKRAKAMEKMQNEIAKAHRKAEERRASAEGKRGIKVAKVLQVSNLMRAVGRPSAKRSFF